MGYDCNSFCQEHMTDEYKAEQTYICALCDKPILPGVKFRYLEREFTDRQGNKAVGISKVHTYHKEGQCTQDVAGTV